MEVSGVSRGEKTPPPTFEEALVAAEKAVDSHDFGRKALEFLRNENKTIENIGVYEGRIKALQAKLLEKALSTKYIGAASKVESIAKKILGRPVSFGVKERAAYEGLQCDPATI